MSRYGRYYFSNEYINNIRDMSRKDREKAEFFADITRDGKIKKSEAQELLDRGYTERDIQRYDSRTFGRAQSYFQDQVQQNRASGSLAYSPLTISRGAGNIFDNALRETGGPSIDDPNAVTGQPVEPPEPLVPENDYQSQITDLLAQMEADRKSAEEAATARQKKFDQDILSLTESFNTRTSELQAGFRSQMQEANRSRQAEIQGIMESQRRQMEQMAAQQAKREQKMQIAQQTQAANAARAGKTGQFQVGTITGTGGIGQFKRRLQIKPMTSSALAIAGGKKSAGNNKMLNV